MNNQDSREQNICDNIGLVHSCARRFLGRNIEYDDLFQAGCMGLVKAVDGFDASRGLRFSTYAVPVIMGEIRRLFRDGGAIKVSRSLKELAMRAAREREAYVNAEGREPAISEMANLLGVEIEQAAEAMGASLPPLSLTRSADSGGSDGDGDGGQIDVPVSPHEDALVDRMALHQVLGELEPHDRSLIVLRYMQNRTQQDTANRLGMTQVQVSRRERAILARMREKLTG